jgi:hypothetical protein
MGEVFMKTITILYFVKGCWLKLLINGSYNKQKIRTLLGMLKKFKLCNNFNICQWVKFL